MPEPVEFALFSPPVVGLLSDAIKILGGALITGIFTYWITRTQMQSKIVEIVAEHQYKARERLFDYYKERGQRLKEDGGKIGETLGNLLYSIAHDSGDGNIDESYLGIANLAVRPIPLEYEIILREARRLKVETLAEFKHLQDCFNAHDWKALVTNREGAVDRMQALIDVYLHLQGCNGLLLRQEAENALEPYVAKPTPTRWWWPQKQS